MLGVADIAYVGRKEGSTIMTVRRQTPRLRGALPFLLLSLPMGIVGFVFVVTTVSAGAPTALVWVGIPVLMLLLTGTRRLADLERTRVHGMLDAAVPRPYRPLPHGPVRSRWLARARDAQTWRDIFYLIILLPVGIVEFTLVVVFWSVSLGLIALPVYYRFLPEGLYAFPSHELRWVTVDSVPTALPWTALGVLVACGAVLGTRALGAGHAWLARALLGPTARRIREAEGRIGHPADLGYLADLTDPADTTAADTRPTRTVAR
ncbi:sensor domain-containing protein [Prauserella halophila]|uniref:Sensor domain-containing protein n=1 Tax=Prauserella halophila TaxID=185641 RepID=A0ABN1W0Y8_9PSEU|nr:sensor domain-containing protein [Prauserella halophila]MCP2235352.1 putative sensor [Prauserella halophila]